MLECACGGGCKPDQVLGKSWAAGRPHAVLYDEDSAALMDVASGKTTIVPWRDLTAFEEKIHPETNEAYLVLLFENGSQIALVDPAVSPSHRRR